MMNGRALAGLVPGLLFLAMAGCASPNPDIYTLQANPGAPVSTAAHVIELRKPGLAGYLDRSDIVLTNANYRVNTNSQLRWAEPIGDMIGRVLTEDLSQRLPNSTVFNESGAITADADLRVEIDIQRFDQGADGRVTLIVEAALEAGHGHTPIRTRHIMLQADTAGPGATQLAAAMSVLLGELADRMAQDVGGTV